jgi:hypothetical protein
MTEQLVACWVEGCSRVLEPKNLKYNQIAYHIVGLG